MYGVPFIASVVRLIQNVNHDTVAGHLIGCDICHQLCPVLHPRLWIVLDSWVLRVVVDEHIKVVPSQELQEKATISIFVPMQSMACFR